MLDAGQDNVTIAIKPYRFHAIMSDMQNPLISKIRYCMKSHMRLSAHIMGMMLSGVKKHARLVAPPQDATH